MNITHSLKPSELKEGDLIEKRFKNGLYDFYRLKSIEIVNGRYKLKFGKYTETVDENVRYHICRIN